MNITGRTMSRIATLILAVALLLVAGPVNAATADPSPDDPIPCCKHG